MVYVQIWQLLKIPGSKGVFRILNGSEISINFGEYTTDLNTDWL